MNSFTTKALAIVVFTISASWMAYKTGVESVKSMAHKAMDSAHLKDSTIDNLTSKLPSSLSSKAAEMLKHAIPSDMDTTQHDDVDEFFTGFVEPFKMPKPTELIKCFGKTSGDIFFRKLRTIDDILQHSKENKMFKVHANGAQFEIYMHALDRAHTCMFNSQDFKNLALKLDIPSDKPTVLKMKDLYYQARYAEIADKFSPIVEKLDKKDFKEAGKILGDIFNDLVQAFKTKGQELLQSQAFANGVYATLNLPLPQESLECFDSKSARSVNDFFKASGIAITDESWYHADKTAKKFWEIEGDAFMRQIPNKVWECNMQSKDAKLVNEKLGVDLNSQEFKDKLWHFINHHNVKFYGNIKSMKKALDEENFLHAGSGFAYFLEAVAK